MDEEVKQQLRALDGALGDLRGSLESGSSRSRAEAESLVLYAVRLAMLVAAQEGVRPDPFEGRSKG